MNVSSSFLCGKLPVDLLLPSDAPDWFHWFHWFASGLNQEAGPNPTSCLQELLLTLISKCSDDLLLSFLPHLHLPP